MIRLHAGGNLFLGCRRRLCCCMLRTGDGGRLYLRQRRVATVEVGSGQARLSWEVEAPECDPPRSLKGVQAWLDIEKQGQ